MEEPTGIKLNTEGRLFLEAKMAVSGLTGDNQRGGKT